MALVQLSGSFQQWPCWDEQTVKQWFKEVHGIWPRG